MEILTFLAEQWLLVGGFVVLALIYLWRERLKSGQPVSAREATALVNADQAVWLDVRDEKAFKAGHMVDALNIPHDKVADRLTELEPHREKTLIVVDKVGQHAGAVGRTLGDQGYQVRRLAGGITEWQNQNLPVVKLR